MKQSKYLLKPLGEIADVQYGKALKSDLRSEGNHPVFGSGGCIGYHNQGIITHPTIIIGRKGSVGNVIFSEVGGWPIDTTFYIKLKSGTHLRYLYYALKNLNLKELAISTSLPGLNRDTLCGQKISLPSINEQIEIASLLDEIDDLRQKQCKAIEMTQLMIPALFYEMFGDPVMNSMGWKVTKIGDHSSKVGSGATPKGGDSAYKAEGIALIRSLNVRDGEFRWKDLARIDDAQAAKLSNVIVEENDILLNITGASVARVCCAPMEVLPARVNQHVCIIRTTSTVQPRFLESLLLASSMKNKLLRIGESGATRQAITKAQVLALEIPLPPIELQKIFTQKAQECLSLLENQKQSLQKLDDLFNSTLHQVFSME